MSCTSTCDSIQKLHILREWMRKVWPTVYAVPFTIIDQWIEKLNLLDQMIIVAFVDKFSTDL